MVDANLDRLHLGVLGPVWHPFGLCGEQPFNYAEQVLPPHRASLPSRGTCDATQHLVPNARATHADRTHRHGFAPADRHRVPLPLGVELNFRFLWRGMGGGLLRQR